VRSIRKFTKRDGTEKRVRARPGALGEEMTPGEVDKEVRGLPEKIYSSRKPITTPGYSRYPNSRGSGSIAVSRDSVSFSTRKRRSALNHSVPDTEETKQRPRPFSKDPGPLQGTPLQPKEEGLVPCTGTLGRPQ
jgi:hypothetical protein